MRKSVGLQSDYLAPDSVANADLDIEGIRNRLVGQNAAQSTNKIIHDTEYGSIAP